MKFNKSWIFFSRFVKFSRLLSAHTFPPYVSKVLTNTITPLNSQSTEERHVHPGCTVVAMVTRVLAAIFFSPHFEWDDEMSLAEQNNVHQLVRWTGFYTVVWLLHFWTWLCGFHSYDAFLMITCVSCFSCLYNFNSFCLYTLKYFVHETGL